MLAHGLKNVFMLVIITANLFSRLFTPRSGYAHAQTHALTLLTSHFSQFL